MSSSLDYVEAYIATVSKDEARREIERHGVLFSDFVEKYGDREEYTGGDVLDWLGY